MRHITNLRGFALIGAALLFSATVAGGLQPVGTASADSAPPQVPLFNTTTGLPQGGEITMTAGPSSISVTVYLQNVEPNTTYTVNGCGADPTTAAFACAAGTPATITTDISGNGTATIILPLMEIQMVAVVDPASSGDSYSTSASTATLTGAAAPSSVPVPAAPPQPASSSDAGAVAGSSGPSPMSTGPVPYSGNGWDPNCVNGCGPNGLP